jgi:hypothetical protein
METLTLPLLSTLYVVGIFLMAIVAALIVGTLSLIITYGILYLVKSASRNLKSPDVGILDPTIIIVALSLYPAVFGAIITNGVVAAITSVASILASVLINLKLWLIAAAVFFLAIIMQEYAHVILYSYQNIYNCVLATFIRQIVLASLNIVVIIIDGILPIYTFGWLLVRGAITQTMIALSSCSVSDYTPLFAQLGFTIGALFADIGNWINTNDIEHQAVNLTSFAVNVGLLAETMVLPMTCACFSSTPFFTAIASTFQNPAFEQVPSNFVNIFVSAVQAPTRTILDGTRFTSTPVFENVCDFTLNSAISVDNGIQDVFFFFIASPIVSQNPNADILENITMPRIATIVIGYPTCLISSLLNMTVELVFNVDTFFGIPTRGIPQSGAKYFQFNTSINYVKWIISGIGDVFAFLEAVLEEITIVPKNVVNIATHTKDFFYDGSLLIYNLFTFVNQVLLKAFFAQIDSTEWVHDVMDLWAFPGTGYTKPIKPGKYGFGQAAFGYARRIVMDASCIVLVVDQHIAFLVRVALFLILDLGQLIVEAFLFIAKILQGELDVAFLLPVTSYPNLGFIAGIDLGQIYARQSNSRNATKIDNEYVPHKARGAVFIDIQNFPPAAQTSRYGFPILIELFTSDLLALGTAAGNYIQGFSSGCHRLDTLGTPFQCPRCRSGDLFCDDFRCKFNGSLVDFAAITCNLLSEDCAITNTGFNITQTLIDRQCLIDAAYFPSNYYECCSGSSENSPPCHLGPMLDAGSNLGVYLLIEVMNIVESTFLLYVGALPTKKILQFNNAIESLSSLLTHSARFVVSLIETNGCFFNNLGKYQGAVLNNNVVVPLRVIQALIDVPYEMLDWLLSPTLSRPPNPLNTFITKIIQIYSKATLALTRAGVDIWECIATGITAFFQVIIDFVDGFIDLLSDAFLQKINVILELISGIFQLEFNKVLDAIVALYEDFFLPLYQGIADKFFTFLTDFVNTISAFGVNLIRTLCETLETIILKIKNVEFLSIQPFINLIPEPNFQCSSIAAGRTLGARTSTKRLNMYKNRIKQARMKSAGGYSVRSSVARKENGFTSQTNYDTYLKELNMNHTENNAELSFAEWEAMVAILPSANAASGTGADDYDNYNQVVGAESYYGPEDVLLFDNPNMFTNEELWSSVRSIDELHLFVELTDNMSTALPNNFTAVLYETLFERRVPASYDVEGITVTNYTSIMSPYAESIKYPSKCDMLFVAYRSYDWITDMRPNERIDILDCLKNILIVQHVINEFGLPNIPLDIINNPVSAMLFGVDIIRTAGIFAMYHYEQILSDVFLTDSAYLEERAAASYDINYLFTTVDSDTGSLLTPVEARNMRTLDQTMADNYAVSWPLLKYMYNKINVTIRTFLGGVETLFRISPVRILEIALKRYENELSDLRKVRSHELREADRTTLTNFTRIMDDTPNHESEKLEFLARSISAYEFKILLFESIKADFALVKKVAEGWAEHDIGTKFAQQIRQAGHIFAGRMGMNPMREITNPDHVRLINQRKATDERIKSEREVFAQAVKKRKAAEKLEMLRHGFNAIQHNQNKRARRNEESQIFDISANSNRKRLRSLYLSDFGSSSTFMHYNSFEFEEGHNKDNQERRDHRQSQSHSDNNNFHRRTSTCSEGQEIVCLDCNILDRILNVMLRLIRATVDYYNVAFVLNVERFNSWAAELPLPSPELQTESTTIIRKASRLQQQQQQQQQQQYTTAAHSYAKRGIISPVGCAATCDSITTFRNRTSTLSYDSALAAIQVLIDERNSTAFQFFVMDIFTYFGIPADRWLDRTICFATNTDPQDCSSGRYYLNRVFKCNPVDIYDAPLKQSLWKSALTASLVIIVASAVIGIAVPFATPLISLLVILWPFIILALSYGYTPICFPVVPLRLAGDIFDIVNTNIFPRCYDWTPGLVINKEFVEANDVCLQCDAIQEFVSPRDVGLTGPRTSVVAAFELISPGFCNRTLAGENWISVGARFVLGTTQLNKFVFGLSEVQTLYFYITILNFYVIFVLLAGGLILNFDILKAVLVILQQTIIFIYVSLLVIYLIFFQLMASFVQGQKNLKVVQTRFVDDSAVNEEENKQDDIPDKEINDTTNSNIQARARFGTMFDARSSSTVPLTIKKFN